MSEYTPGPWVVVGDADPEIHTNDGTWITSQVLGADSGDDGQANARLIAAAPDLLAICREMQAYLRRFMSGDLPPESLAGRLEAVIAKAEGKPCLSEPK